MYILFFNEDRTQVLCTVKDEIGTQTNAFRRRTNVKNDENIFLEIKDHFLTPHAGSNDPEMNQQIELLISTYILEGFIEISFFDAPQGRMIQKRISKLNYLSTYILEGFIEIGPMIQDEVSYKKMFKKNQTIKLSAKSSS